MNSREKYKAVMRGEPGVPTMLWEIGYWSSTMERWYGEGVARSPYSPPPGFPAGSAVFGEAMPWPHMPGLVRYRDIDVHRRLGFDEGMVRIPLTWRCSPAFQEKVLEEDATTRVIINGDGLKLRVRKDTDSIPQFLEWPVHDRKSWEEIKEERFGMDIMPRFPSRWAESAKTYRKDRDFLVGVVLDGFFSLPRELFGVESQLMMYFDDPKLMHDINKHTADLWLAMLEEVLSKVDLDFVYFWEDMAFKNGPLMSPLMFEEFVVPYYKRMTGFLKERGCDIIFVDTDGYCRDLIPGFLRGGVTGLYPFEVQAGMDVVKVRKEFPQLQMLGGIDKKNVAAGKAAIDRELEAKLPFMLSRGRYIPSFDHQVPPDVPWEHFEFYRQKVREYAGKYFPKSL